MTRINKIPFFWQVNLHLIATIWILIHNDFAHFGIIGTKLKIDLAF